MFNPLGSTARACSALALFGAVASLGAACGSSNAASTSSGGSSASSSSASSSAATSSSGGGAPCAGCANGLQCCASVCVAAPSCGFAVTSLSASTGYQNGGDWIVLTGAGFAQGMKVFLGDGRAPVRVVSPTEATILTPPGEGSVDVRVELGGQKATLPKGFSYQSGGLKSAWIERPLSAPRGRAPGLAVLQDGRVLVTGGVKGPNGYEPDTATDTAELFTRATETFSPAASPMSTVRWYEAAVTLLDGRVLVVGGACWQNMSSCNGDPQKADLFDPKTGAFTPTKSPLSVARVFPRAVLLVDGRVLIDSVNDPSVEIFDPTTDAFTSVMPPDDNGYGFMVRLRDGHVLRGGGSGVGSAVLFDSDTNMFAVTGSLQTQRYWPTAHTLPDGRVAVLGGSTGTCCGWEPLASIELYDPKAGMFSTAPFALTAPRFEQASALVRDGTILVVGGFTVSGDCSSYVDAVDQVDVAKGTVTPFPKLPHKATELSAVTLLDGSVLVAGGGGCGSDPVPFVDFLEDDPTPK